MESNLLQTKCFIPIILLLLAYSNNYCQVNVGLSLGIGFENLLTPSNSAAYDLNDRYGNIGPQIGVNGLIKVSKKFELKLDIIYAPKKEVPYSVPTFADLLDTYSYQSVKSSLSLSRKIKDFSIGLGFSISEVFSRRHRYVHRGWMPSNDCTMIGGVITANYRFEKFYINGLYRVERHNKLPLGCSDVNGVRSIEFGLGYYLTKAK